MKGQKSNENSGTKNITTKNKNSIERLYKEFRHHRTNSNEWVAG